MERLRFFLIKIKETPFREKNPFFFFFSLILLLVCLPFLESSFHGKLVLNLFMLATLISSLYSVSSHTHYYLFALLLATPSFLLIPLHNIFGLGASYLELVQLYSLLFFYFYTILILFFNLFKQKEISLRTIYGSVSIYILLGIFWTIVYLLFLKSNPETFNVKIGENEIWSTLIYYSFSTQTTLGYGDIFALTSEARIFSVLQTVFGVMYITVIIPRFIGLHLAKINLRD